MATIEQRMIGPIEAADLLRYNTHNRPLDERRIDLLSADMSSGRWKETGIPVIVRMQGTERVIEDGQHRLHAIIRAHVTVPLYIATVNETVFDVVDQNKGRSLRDLMRGREGNRNGLAAVGPALAWLDVGLNAKQYTRLSNAARYACIDRYPADAAWGQRLFSEIVTGCSRRQPPAGFMAGAIMVHRLNDTDATRFFTQVATGEMLVTTAPAYRLRALLLVPSRESPVTSGYSGAAATVRWVEAVVRAWNASVAGRPMQHFRLSGNVPPVAHYGAEIAAD